MSATAATAKKQKPLKRHPSKLKQASAYTILTLILIPTFYLIFDKRSRQERRAAKKPAKSQRSGKTGDAENE